MILVSGFLEVHLLSHSAVDFFLTDDYHIPNVGYKINGDCSVNIGTTELRRVPII
jgi:hypothetical protein